MNRKAIFFDVDGTLVECTKGMINILDSTKKAIKQIKDKGHLAILATGRPKAYLSKEILDLEFDAYITSNGAYIEMDGKEIYNKRVDKERLKEITEFLNKQNIEYILESQKCSYCSNLNYININKFIKTIAIPSENITDEINLEDAYINKMVLFIENERELKECSEFFGGSFKWMELSGLNCYDFYFKDCSKADGVQKLVEYLGVDIDNTFAFGDGINDIEMFRKVKYGIAMGNANEKLKEIAYHVTDDIFSHGIYKGIMKLKII